MIVENDAVIARALQEELSRDAAAEGSGLNNTEYVREHYNDPLHASNVENDAVIARALQEELSSESALDGEVGNRIAEMVLFPHAPKTNGEIPSEDEQMSDHQRLLERLKSCDCVEKKVQGDGNCQFRSLSDQLYRSPEHHQVVRELVVKQLESEPERYNGYVPMAYGDYLKKMNKFMLIWLKLGVVNGVITSHCRLLQIRMVSRYFLITSFRDTCCIEIFPKAKKSNRVIYLSFWAEVHYDSIYPEGV
ncbi:CYSTEINE PROTEINASE SUPERFAMILY PROTEIN [Salix koriyanagi]|uniref:CYSTEINE PROTEINASE SUPERFAMILY PROTEIN n=1 Tax=Salix koriyanagi TaxID=2511006 RepID=A0A9Q0WIK5_9ROSI|nr:CYSTEINE PROTEINASE SUPERFAMILY PROTEIN [Salix koriyanagi]